MSKKKGLSVEEKVEKVAGWFESHSEPYTLKELQSLIPKSTGVIYQSIEECVEILVAENRLNQEKIGVQTYIWKFPQTEAQKQQALITKLNTVKNSKNPAVRLATMSVSALQARHSSLEENLARLNAAIHQRQAEVGSPEESKSEMQQIETLMRRRAQHQMELQQLAVFDPEMIDKLHRSTEIAVEAVNRWTENFFLLEDYITSRMGQSSKELRTLLCIPSEFDYIDLNALSREQSPVKDANGNSSSPALQLCAASALPHPEGGVSNKEDSSSQITMSVEQDVCEQLPQNMTAYSKTLSTCEASKATKEGDEATKQEEVVVVNSSTPSPEKKKNIMESSSSGGVKPSVPLNKTVKSAKTKGKYTSKEPPSAALQSSTELKGAATKSKGKEKKKESPKEEDNPQANAPLQINGVKRTSSSRAGEGKRPIKAQRICD